MLAWALHDKKELLANHLSQNTAIANILPLLLRLLSDLSKPHQVVRIASTALVVGTSYYQEQLKDMAQLKDTAHVVFAGVGLGVTLISFLQSYGKENCPITVLTGNPFLSPIVSKTIKINLDIMDPPSFNDTSLLDIHLGKAPEPAELSSGSVGPIATTTPTALIIDMSLITPTGPTTQLCKFLQNNQNLFTSLISPASMTIEAYLVTIRSENNLPEKVKKNIDQLLFTSESKWGYSPETMNLLPQNYIRASEKVLLRNFHFKEGIEWHYEASAAITAIAEHVCAHAIVITARLDWANHSNDFPLVAVQYLDSPLPVEGELKCRWFGGSFCIRLQTADGRLHPSVPRSTRFPQWLRKQLQAEPEVAAAWAQATGDAIEKHFKKKIIRMDQLAEAKIDLGSNCEVVMQETFGGVLPAVGLMSISKVIEERGSRPIPQLHLSCREPSPRVAEFCKQLLRQSANVLIEQEKPVSQGIWKKIIPTKNTDTTDNEKASKEQLNKLRLRCNIDVGGLEPPTNERKNAVEVLVSQQISESLIGDGLLTTLNHYQKHFMAKSGTTVPEKARLMGIPISFNAKMGDISLDNWIPVLGDSIWELSTLGLPTVSTKADMALIVSLIKYVSESPQILGEWDLRRSPSQDSLTPVTVEFPSNMDCRVDGLLVWYDIILSSKAGVTNRPKSAPGTSIWEGVSLTEWRNPVVYICCLKSMNYVQGENIKLKVSFQPDVYADHCFSDESEIGLRQSITTTLEPPALHMWDPQLTAKYYAALDELKRKQAPLEEALGLLCSCHAAFNTPFDPAYAEVLSEAFNC